MPLHDPLLYEIAFTARCIENWKRLGLTKAEMMNAAMRYCGRSHSGWSREAFKTAWGF